MPEADTLGAIFVLKQSRAGSSGRRLHASWPDAALLTSLGHAEHTWVISGWPTLPVSGLSAVQQRAPTATLILAVERRRRVSAGEVPKRRAKVGVTSLIFAPLSAGQKVSGSGLHGITLRPA